MLEIGESLREARRRADVELRSVSAATRIPLRFLSAMEQDNFDVLPPGLYRRSFLREYAVYLGLDGDVYADEYQRRFEPEPEPPPAPVHPERGVALAGAIGRLHPRGAAIVALIVLLAVGLWQLGGSSTPHLGANTPPLGPSAPHVDTAPAGAGTRPKAHQTPPTTIPSLTLQAENGDCWLLVQLGSSTGPVLYERTLLPGERVHFGLRRALWIRVGAPWNLSARIGTRNVSSTLPPSTGEFVATRTGLTEPPSTSSIVATADVSAARATSETT